QASETLDGVTPVLRRLVGAVGGSVSVPVLPLTRSRSRLGPPLAVVAVARTVLPPAVRVVVTVTSAQVSQLAVGLNATPAATRVPLTVISIGRLAVDPLAWRTDSFAVPALAALTVHCTYEPATLV